MTRVSGHFIAVDHSPTGAGFEVALWGRNIGRVCATSVRSTHKAALLAAAEEAEKRGGIAIEDRTAGAAECA